MTHTHTDHVGAIDTLMQHWPNAELLVGAADTANLTKLGVRTAPTRLLRGGDRVGSLTVIDTPGHSPGHVAYLDERDGMLYSGDTFANVPRLLVASVLHAIFPLPTFGTHDPAQTTRAARALLDVPLRTLATGHGPAIQGPLPAMRRAVQEAGSGREPGVVTRVAAGWVAHLTRLSTDGAVAGKALAYRDNRPS
nr:MBL fold metallo-hydrolase [Deinococcus daejeonensis]